jgi:hypothetical protein
LDYDDDDITNDIDNEQILQELIDISYNTSLHKLIIKWTTIEWTCFPQPIVHGIFQRMAMNLRVLDIQLTGLLIVDDIDDELQPIHDLFSCIALLSNLEELWINDDDDVLDNITAEIWECLQPLGVKLRGLYLQEYYLTRQELKILQELFPRLNEMSLQLKYDVWINDVVNVLSLWNTTDIQHCELNITLDNMPQDQWIPICITALHSLKHTQGRILILPEDPEDTTWIGWKQTDNIQSLRTKCMTRRESYYCIQK